MANLMRQQIREGVAAILVGLPLTGARVFQSRSYALAQTELPALLVYSLSEEIETLTMNLPRQQRRTLTLTVEAVAAAVSNVDDTLDSICKDVEIAIANGWTAITGLRDAVSISQRITLSGDSEKPHASASIEYNFVYFVYENAPDVAT